MKFSFKDHQSVPKDKFGSIVPPDFHGLYVEKDGNMVLDSEHAGVKSAIAAITGLNNSLDAARKDAETNKVAKVDLTPLKDYGETPDTILEGINAKIKEVTKGKVDPAKLEEQLTKIKADLATEYQAKIDSGDKRSSALLSQLKTVLVDNAATNELAAAGAVSPDLVLPHVVSQIKVNEAEGVFNVQVIDKQGDPRYNGATAAPMTVKELVGTMKADEKYATLFKSEVKKGGGAGPTKVVIKSADGTEKTSTEKISAGLEARAK